MALAAILAAFVVLCAFLWALCYWILTGCPWPPERSKWRRPSRP